jgi:large subunit ribosomal protein L10e
MAKLRAAHAYRRVKRPYTRISKKRKKSFVKGVPGSKIVHFDMGAKDKQFPYAINVVARREVNLRHNAIEAARATANRHMNSIAKGFFAIKIRAVPHHVMRMKPLATGAGADRFSQGMRRAFGKPIGKSCHVKPGKVLFSIYTEEKYINLAKRASKKIIAKFPIPCGIEVEERKIKPQTPATKVKEEVAEEVAQEITA